MQIRSEVASVLRALANQTYRLDVYQRTYVWEAREIGHFLTDLEDYALDWAADPNAPAWFLGAVLVERRKESAYLVDGQQRLVTLSLLLLAAHARAEKTERDAIKLALGGEGRELALPVDEPRYQQVFAQLTDTDVTDAYADWDPDQRRIADAFFRIRDWVEETAPKGEAGATGVSLSTLIDGVLRRTMMDIISVRDTETAYRLFASLNDRGKRLSPDQAIKSLILMEAADEDERAQFADAWERARAEARDGSNGDNPVNEALKAALVARAAPPRAFRGAGDDTDLKDIRNDPFRWLAAEHVDVPIHHVGRELPFFLRLYSRLAEAAAAPAGGAEAVHFIVAAGLPLEHWAPVVMAGLDPHGPPEENAQKASAIVAFLDVIAARLAWRPGWMTPARVRDALFALIPRLRELEPEALAYLLGSALASPFGRDLAAHAKLHVGAGGVSMAGARAILARLTAHVETFAAEPQGDYAVFAAGGRQGFALAHIIPPKPKGEDWGYREPEGLVTQRDQLGALVLAPPRLAREADKLADFAKAKNALAVAVSADAAPDPRLSGLDAPLGGYPEGLAVRDVDARQNAYAALAAAVWDPVRVAEAAADPNPRLIKALGLHRAY